ncbi:MAG: S8/S53 family peptidase [Candidatus Omnitrophica bacterium]|nr:S8/S53 family peptidase [Candidatus Omnitrophota bacterium]
MKEKDYAIFKLEMKKIYFVTSFLVILVSSTFAWETADLKREYGKGAETLIHSLSLNPTAYLFGYGEEIPEELLEKFLPNLVLEIKAEKEEEVRELSFTSAEEKRDSFLPQIPALPSPKEETEKPPIFAQREEIKNLVPEQESEKENNLKSIFKREELKPLLKLTRIDLSFSTLPEISFKEVNFNNYSGELPPIKFSVEAKILTAQEIIPVYSPQPYEFKSTSVKLPEQKLPEPYIPENRNNLSSLSLPASAPEAQTSTESNPTLNLSLPSSGISGLSLTSTPSLEPEKKEENNLPPFLIAPLSAKKEGQKVSGIQKISEKIGNEGKEPPIRVGILDIDPKHAELVKKVLVEKILEKNPHASIEIITYLLPGEEVGGGKEVCESAFLQALAEIGGDGVRVLNMSIGPADGKLSSLLVSALQDLAEKVFIVASSGNEGKGVSSWSDAGRAVLSVGACGENYSNQGDTCRPAYSGLPGTSFTAPQVAAEVVLALWENPFLKRDELFASLSENFSSSTQAESFSQAEILLIPGFYTFTPSNLKGFGLFSPSEKTSSDFLIW